MRADADNAHIVAVVHVKPPWPCLLSHHRLSLHLPPRNIPHHTLQLTPPAPHKVEARAATVYDDYNNVIVTQPYTKQQTRRRQQLPLSYNCVPNTSTAPPALCMTTETDNDACINSRRCHCIPQR
jgi:hypothetical protein